ncbi:MAG: peptide ABC transporter substrate-binding protein [Alphaproteobacteria bacterium]|nr:peptide ABC transporter substrate-binding protein [Alphaproteobacteria bacterium]
MNEQDIRGLVEGVKSGEVTRRSFVERMLAVGIAAPVSTAILAHSGVAMAQAATTYKPTKRGGGGPLKVLWWQGPTLLNPHFATGTKDQDGSRVFYEPLAAWDPNGIMVPILAAEVPTRENGGLAADGKSATWKLKQGVKWHDGQPFTADDVVFNWEYARDPATAAVTSGSYKDVTVEKVNDYTVKVSFPVSKPFWADAFVGATGMIIPKHLFKDFAGAKSREAPTNLKPVGTGPYIFKEFKPGDLLTGVINPNYHMANRPYFDSIEVKGGGDAVSAARAVLQTGEYDFAWNMQVEDEVLQRLEKGGKGRVVINESGSIEHIQFNTTDPWTEVDGERSSIKTVHPTLSDKAVRDAIALLIDRESVEKYIYGRTGFASVNYLVNPPRFRSKNIPMEFNVDKAIDILEKAGWKKGADGIREKGGKKLKFVYQTSINQPRQKTQAIVKQACQKAGIDIEIKSVTASVYFSSDVANPDTYPHFYTDLQMYTTGPGFPDPGVWMQSYLSREVCQKDNKWQGRNITRYRNKAWDDLYFKAEEELDPIKRAAMYIELNDMVVRDRAVVGVIGRAGVSAVNNKLQVNPSGWDSNFWDLASWYMDA